MKLWLYAVEAWVKPLAKLIPIQQLFYRMICHVTRILHHTLLALDCFRNSRCSTRYLFQRDERCSSRACLSAGASEFIDGLERGACPCR